MTNLCPSCREPLDFMSGDGCAAMTLHNDKTFNKEDPLLNLTLDDYSDTLKKLKKYTKETKEQLS